MSCYYIIFASLVGLLARTSFAIDCYSNSHVVPAQCSQAMSQIVYQSDDTLDQRSSIVSKVSGNCSIIINKPKEATVTKKQIVDTIAQIINQCNPNAGGGDVDKAADVFVNIGNRGTGPYEPDFPYGKSVCGLNTGAPDALPADCQTAYQSLHVDNGGHFLTDAWQRSEFIQKTYKSCTLLIYTTDESMLLATRKLVDKTFEGMLAECKGKSGVVNIGGGADGLNGHTVVKIRNSMPCQGKTEAPGQICR